MKSQSIQTECKLQYNVNNSLVAMEDLIISMVLLRCLTMGPAEGFK